MIKVEQQYINLVKRFYSNDIKKYHTIFHVKNLFDLYLENRKNFQEEFPTLNEKDLYEAIAWHDSVYIPGCPLNEEFSAQLFYHIMNLNEHSSVYDIIISTKIGTKKFNNPEEKVMHDLDWSGFSDYNQMLENEKKIFYESTCDEKYTENEVYQNQLKFYKSIVDNNIYVTNTFKNLHCNEAAKRNLEKRIKEMENEN